MSVRGLQTVRGAAVLTVWARTTVSARRATGWSEAGDAKVSVFKALSSENRVSSVILLVTHIQYRINESAV